MSVFQFEMKQYRGSILIWSIGLSLAIMLLLPMFVSFTDDPSTVSSLGDNALLDAMGISEDVFITMTGIFSYLNNIILVAAAIHACNLGLSIITKEHMQNTADFLITKPYARATIFFAKIFAGLCAIAVVGGSYFLASWGTINTLSDGIFSFDQFFKIYMIFPLTQLFFLLLGMVISVIVSRISATLPLAMGISFGFYVIGLFSSVIQSTIARLFSPFRYFDINRILEAQNYETGYLLLFFTLILLFFIVSYRVYLKKDMKMVL
ncbi:ABC transporter permease subunit [Enterococcus olivae]